MLLKPGGQSPPADANADGVVDIRDLIFVVKYINESELTNTRADINGDHKVDVEDLVWIIKVIEATLPGAAPSKNSLSGADVAALHMLYEKIEDTSTDFAQIELVKRFLLQLLMPAERPLETKLHANYPNPFNPETWIPYQLAEDTEVTIRIYNASGHVVRTLFTGIQDAGYYLSRSRAAYWDGNNKFGEASGERCLYLRIDNSDISADETTCSTKIAILDFVSGNSFLQQLVILGQKPL